MIAKEKLTRFNRRFDNIIGLTAIHAMTNAWVPILRQKKNPSLTSGVILPASPNFQKKATNTSNNNFT